MASSSSRSAILPIPGGRWRENTEVRLCKPAIAPLRMSCTLYSQAAVRTLVGLTERFDRPVDTFVQMSWVTGCGPLITIPSGVREISAEIGGSTIQKSNKSLFERVQRDMAQSLHRGNCDAGRGRARMPE